tara:strand:+ start:334 stop:648 length:315 start_codon:yes stop_codon:yes gene_type:complete
MAKDNIIEFPLNKKPSSVKARVHTYQTRIDEIEVENQYIKDDIAYLKKALAKNKEELVNMLKDLAIINGEANEMFEPIVEFENEWGDDFEFIPDFNLDDNPEED